MVTRLRTCIGRLANGVVLRPLKLQFTRPHAPLGAFHSAHYLRHNRRRQEHLASLNLPLARLSVLEVGAGIGDHTGFFVDRGCAVTSTEVRPENLNIIRDHFPDILVKQLDMDRPDDGIIDAEYDIVYCYGLLHHLRRPAEAIEFMARHCRRMLLLETCVSFGEEEEVHPVPEEAENVTQSFVGVGCRPTRPWIFRELQSRFAHVYVTETQPWHEEFPIDWTVEPHNGRPSRSIFVASRVPLDSSVLLENIPMRQRRH